jgi:16S rRNA processing protein RimM
MMFKFHGDRTKKMEDLIKIGVLTQAFGLYGALKFRPSGDPEALKGLKKVFIESRGWLEVKRIDFHEATVAIRFVGITSRPEALEMKGLEVFADRDAVKLAEGSYFYHDLIGLEVVKPSGDLLGVVKDIMDAGSSDILVIRYGKKDVLVPLQAPYVRVLEGKLEIDPIPGLFDDK